MKVSLVKFNYSNIVKENDIVLAYYYLYYIIYIYTYIILIKSTWCIVLQDLVVVSKLKKFFS